MLEQIGIYIQQIATDSNQMTLITDSNEQHSQEWTADEMLFYIKPLLDGLKVSYSVEPAGNDYLVRTYY